MPEPKFETKEISFDCGTFANVKTVKAKAFCLGDYAVHPYTGFRFVDEVYQDRDRWVLTHIPTQLAIYTFDLVGTVGVKGINDLKKRVKQAAIACQAVPKFDTKAPSQEITEALREIVKAARLSVQ